MACALVCVYALLPATRSILRLHGIGGQYHLQKWCVLSCFHSACAPLLKLQIASTLLLQLLQFAKR